MNKPTLYFAALALVLAGCAPSTAPTNGGTSEKNDSGGTVGQNAPTNPALSPDGAGAPTATTSTTTTQGATAAPGQGGGEAPTAGGGQRGGGRGFGIGFLVGNDQIKAELKITADQAKKLEALVPQRGGQGGPGGGAQAGGAAPGGGQQMTPEERQKQRDEMEAKVKAILTPAQVARLQEIQYQIMGPRAFSNADVVKALGITADQSKQIEALMPQRGGQGGPGGGAQAGGAAPGGGQQMTPEERQKQRDELMGKIEAVLTPAQKAKWTKMTGKPFKFQFQQRSGGGGGGGGSMVPK